MVAVGVGAQDRDHAAPGDGAQQRVHMRGIIRAGVDHRHVACPYDVALRAGVGEGRRIGRQHTRHHRRERHGFAGGHIGKVWYRVHCPHVPCRWMNSRAGLELSREGRRQAMFVADGAWQLRDIRTVRAPRYSMAFPAQSPLYTVLSNNIRSPITAPIRFRNLVLKSSGSDHIMCANWRVSKCTWSMQSSRTVQITGIPNPCANPAS
jgi:hypothetical protein